MTIIVFLVDNSASMAQKTSTGITYLDFARQIVDNFVKVRRKMGVVHFLEFESCIMYTDAHVESMELHVERTIDLDMPVEMLWEPIFSGHIDFSNSQNPMSFSFRSHDRNVRRRIWLED